MEAEDPPHRWPRSTHIAALKLSSFTSRRSWRPPRRTRRSAGAIGKTLFICWVPVATEHLLEPRKFLQCSWLLLTNLELLALNTQTLEGEVL